MCGHGAFGVLKSQARSLLSAAEAGPSPVDVAPPSPLAAETSVAELDDVRVTLRENVACLS